MRKAWKSKAVKGILTAACAMLFFLGHKEICFADTTGKVTADSAKIRQSANVNSEVIGSTSAGKTVNITGEVTDASGSIWYEVYVDADTKGYIRSDLVSVDGSVPSIQPSSDTGNTEASNTDNTTTPSTSAEGAEIPAETEMDAQYATVKVATAKVRSGASTTKGIIDLLSENTQVIVSGQTNGNDGNIWYYITYTGADGVEKTGYIRNDLINLGEMVPMEEPAQEAPEDMGTEAPTEPSAVNNDYQLIYELNPDGEFEYYLYDNTGEQKTRQKLAEVLAAAHAQSLNNDTNAKTVSKQKIAIVILIAIILLLAGLMTFMFFKLRDAYYEAYEDDEEEEPSQHRKKERAAEQKEETIKKKGLSLDEKPMPSRGKPTPQEAKKTPARKRTSEYEREMPEKEVTYEEEPAARISTPPKRKAKNFLLEDDEFEFEFLNMKDSKKGM